MSAAALLAARVAPAQRGGRVPRLGYLLLTPVMDPPSRERQAFVEGLHDFGYVHGRTIELVYKSAEGEPDFIDVVARELVALRPDVIAVPGEPTALAAKRATSTIPIVVLALGDPVGIGLVPSLAKPGGNVTGVSFISSELTSKRLQFALECVPQARRLAVLWDVRNTNSRAEARAVQDAARSRGLDVALLTARTDQEFARRLDGVAAERPDLLYVTFEGGLVAANRTRIAELGLRARIPVVSGWHALTEAGALMSYAPDIAAMFRRAAYHVDRILKGARPGDLPIELPTKVDLVLNQRTATALGVRFPQDMLLRAERVIA